MAFAIRPYADADFNAVTSIWLESWKSTGVSVAAAATLPLLRERLPQEITKGWNIYVAEDDQEIVGFLALHGNCLEQLWVSPAMQGQGIGRRMLDFVKARLLGGFWLTTAIENTGACRFYEREGLTRGAITVHHHLGHKIVRYDWRSS